MAVVSGPVEINLQVNLSMLISCYGIYSDAKKFAKSIITIPVNVRYDNLNQTILLSEKYLNLSLYFSFIIFSRVNETPILVITLRAQIFMEFLQLKPEKIQNIAEFNLCFM